MQMQLLMLPSTSRFAWFGNASRFQSDCGAFVQHVGVHTSQNVARGPPLWVKQEVERAAFVQAGAALRGRQGGGPGADSVSPPQRVPQLDY